MRLSICLLALILHHSNFGAYGYPSNYADVDSGGGGPIDKKSNPPNSDYNSTADSANNATAQPQFTQNKLPLVTYITTSTSSSTSGPTKSTPLTSSAGTDSSTITLASGKSQNLQPAFVYKAAVPEYEESIGVSPDNNTNTSTTTSTSTTSTNTKTTNLNSQQQPQQGADVAATKKVIGSSVTSSVSVVLNGNEPEFTDALGHKVPKPQPSLQVASPIDLLNPDRYEFYTFDENGELVKRLMTMEEIQSIVANGDGEGPTIIHPMPMIDKEPEKNVQDIVDSVQTVLNKEVASNRNSTVDAIHLLDTPDVSSSWSMILPAIFGNTGGEFILQQKPQQIVMTPDSEILETSTVKAPTSKKPKPNKRKPGQKRKTSTTTTTTTEMTPQVVQEELGPAESVYTGMQQYQNMAANMQNYDTYTDIQMQPLYHKLPEILQSTETTTKKVFVNNQEIIQTSNDYQTQAAEASILSENLGKKPGNVPNKYHVKKPHGGSTTKRPPGHHLKTKKKPTATRPPTKKPAPTTPTPETTTEIPSTTTTTEAPATTTPAPAPITTLKPVVSTTPKRRKKKPTRTPGGVHIHKPHRKHPKPFIQRKPRPPPIVHSKPKPTFEFNATITYHQTTHGYSHHGKRPVQPTTTPIPAEEQPTIPPNPQTVFSYNHHHHHLNKVKPTIAPAPAEEQTEVSYGHHEIAFGHHHHKVKVTTPAPAPEETTLVPTPSPEQPEATYGHHPHLHKHKPAFVPITTTEEAQVSHGHHQHFSKPKPTAEAPTESEASYGHHHHLSKPKPTSDLAAAGSAHQETHYVHQQNLGHHKPTKQKPRPQKPVAVKPSTTTTIITTTTTFGTATTATTPTTTTPPPAKTEAPNSSADAQVAVDVFLDVGQKYERPTTMALRNDYITSPKTTTTRTTTLPTSTTTTRRTTTPVPAKVTVVPSKITTTTQRLTTTTGKATTPAPKPTTTEQASRPQMSLSAASYQDQAEVPSSTSGYPIPQQSYPTLPTLPNEDDPDLVSVKKENLPSLALIQQQLKEHPKPQVTVAPTRSPAEEDIKTHIAFDQIMQSLQQDESEENLKPSIPAQKKPLHPIKYESPEDTDDLEELPDRRKKPIVMEEMPIVTTYPPTAAHYGGSTLASMLVDEDALTSRPFQEILTTDSVSMEETTQSEELDTPIVVITAKPQYFASTEKIHHISTTHPEIPETTEAAPQYEATPSSIDRLDDNEALYETGDEDGIQDKEELQSIPQTTIQPDLGESYTENPVEDTTIMEAMESLYTTPQPPVSNEMNIHDKYSLGISRLPVTMPQKIEDLANEDGTESPPLVIDLKPQLNMEVLAPTDQISMSDFQTQAATVASILVDGSNTFAADSFMNSNETKDELEFLVSDVLQQISNQGYYKPMDPNANRLTNFAHLNVSSMLKPIAAFIEQNRRKTTPIPMTATLSTSTHSHSNISPPQDQKTQASLNEKKEEGGQNYPVYEESTTIIPSKEDLIKKEEDYLNSLKENSQNEKNTQKEEKVQTSTFRVPILSLAEIYAQQQKVEDEMENSGVESTLANTDPEQDKLPLNQSIESPQGTETNNGDTQQETFEQNQQNTQNVYNENTQNLKPEASEINNQETTQNSSEESFYEIPETTIQPSEAAEEEEEEEDEVETTTFRVPILSLSQIYAQQQQMEEQGAQKEEEEDEEDIQKPEEENSQNSEEEQPQYETTQNEQLDYVAPQKEEANLQSSQNLAAETLKPQQTTSDTQSAESSPNEYPTQEITQPDTTVSTQNLPEVPSQEQVAYPAETNDPSESKENLNEAPSIPEIETSTFKVPVLSLSQIYAQQQEKEEEKEALYEAEREKLQYTQEHSKVHLNESNEKKVEFEMTMGNGQMDLNTSASQGSTETELKGEENSKEKTQESVIASLEKVNENVSEMDATETYPFQQVAEAEKPVEDSDSVLVMEDLSTSSQQSEELSPESTTIAYSSDEENESVSGSEQVTDLASLDKASMFESSDNGSEELAASLSEENTEESQELIEEDPYVKLGESTAKPVNSKQPQQLAAAADASQEEETTTLREDPQQTPPQPGLHMGLYQEEQEGEPTTSPYEDNQNNQEDEEDSEDQGGYQEPSSSSSSSTTSSTSSTTTTVKPTKRLNTLKPVSYYKQPSLNAPVQVEPPKIIAYNAVTPQNRPMQRPLALSNLMASPNLVTRPPVKLEPSPEYSQGLEASTGRLDEDVHSFARLCNELAFSYWRSITSEKISSARSLVMSPFALTSMLSMVFLGARGSTSGEMNEILKLDDMVTFNPHLIFKNVTESVEKSTDSDIATAAFVREVFSDRANGRILQFFKEKTQQLYAGHVEEVNFHVVNDIIRRRTNLLIKRHTMGKVLEYLRTNSVWVNGPLATISANLFQTDCTHASTQDRDGEMFFQVHPSLRQKRVVPIPAVLYKSGFTAGYEPNLDATIVAFGRLQDTVSTIYVMPGHQSSISPSDNLDRLEKDLVNKAFTENAWSKLLRSLMDRPGMEVQLPRFSHRSFVNASLGLQKMGLKGLFKSDLADLRGLTGAANHDIYLSDMIQINTFSTCGEERISDHHHVEMYPAPPLRKRNKDVNARDENDDDSSEAIIDFGSIVQDSVLGRGFYDDLLDPKYLELPLSLRPRQARVPDTPRLRFDKPFLYFVRHNPTGMILFMGRFNPRLLP